MKIIDINDIEELIIFKHESDKLSNKKSDLQEFLQTYTNLTKIYVTKHNETIPFDIFTINGVKVLFTCFENDKAKNNFIEKMQIINFNLDNLSEVPIENQMKSMQDTNKLVDIFFINNKIYK